jgi:hypothetical protein
MTRVSFAMNLAGGATVAIAYGLFLAYLFISQ